MPKLQQRLNILNNTVEDESCKNSILIKLANYCNLNCRYCFPTNKVNQPIEYKLMSFDEFKRIFKQSILDNNSVRELIKLLFTGGEPLLNWPVLRRICAFLSTAEYKLPVNIEKTIITNGALLSLEKIKYLIKHNTNISISYDGKATEFFRVDRNGKSIKAKVEKILLICLETGIFNSLELNWIIHPGREKGLEKEIRDLLCKYPNVLRRISFRYLNNIPTVVARRAMLRIQKTFIDDLEICVFHCEDCQIKNSCNGFASKNN